MRMDNALWEESLSHGLKVERNLNFSTIANEDDEYGFSRKKAARDPMSHRIIEKRRRDRMNNCLADLSRLVPTNYLKKGRGRIEKTEIIEMAIKHLKHLQAHPCKDMATCEVARVTEQDHKRQYSLGFHECLSETVRFLVEIEGLYAGDGLCVRLVSHLQKHYDKVAGGMCYTQALSMMQAAEDTKHLPMDVDSLSHPPPLDSYVDTTTNSAVVATPASSAAPDGPLHVNHNGGDSNHRPLPPPPTSAELYSSSEVLKHEHDANSNSTVASLHEHSDYANGSASNSATNNNSNNGSSTPVATTGSPVKVASQLREMLQNPGLPTKDNIRSSQFHPAMSNASSVIPPPIHGPQPSNFHGVVNVSSPHPPPPPSHNQQPISDPQQHHTQPPLPPSQSLQQQQQISSSKNDEVYKFKNNIKHRFNADLRHHTASPTESHSSDHVSLPDEDRTIAAVATNGHVVSEDRLASHGGPAMALLHSGHNRAFVDYHHAPAAHSELSVKIPERTIDDAGHSSSHWDSHAETGSSCGSNPSTPPAARSNGSSSGYSTSGEMPPVSKFRPTGGHHHHNSPATSPYSRSPDHIGNRSPSPVTGGHQGVPIFALHPKGTFYIPLTLDAGFLAPHLLGTDEVSPVLHPVSICVNFSFCHSVKVEKLNGSSPPSSCHFRSSQTYLMDRYNERYSIYGAEGRPRL